MRKTNSEAVKRAQKRKKMEMVELFGGKCTLCGYDKCIDALEFHHLDENTKEQNPSYIVMRWSKNRAMVELEKCILVCANCHRELHAKVHDINVELVTRISPWYDHTCVNCKEVFRSRVSTQIYCSERCKQVGGRKVTRPDKDQLQELLRTTSLVQIGKRFGVSDNAVRKWAKHYKLTL
jgi:hypothetical protein